MVGELQVDTNPDGFFKIFENIQKQIRTSLKFFFETARSNLRMEIIFSRYMRDFTSDSADPGI